MSTAEMIRVNLVSVSVANRMLASHLCQSKTGEVLNTFHPESGGGARSTIRKSAEGQLVCRFLRLVLFQVEVFGDVVVLAVRQEARGRCSRNYIPRIKESWGLGGWGGRIWGMHCAAPYVVWPRDGDLSTYRQAWRSETTNKQGKKWSTAIMRVHALAYAYSAVDAHKVAPESKEK